MGDFTQPQLNLLHLVKIAFCNRCQFLPCPKNFSNFFVHIIWVCKHSDFFFKSHPGTLSLATTIYDLERSVILAHRGGIIRQVFLGFLPPQGVKFRNFFFLAETKVFTEILPINQTQLFSCLTPPSPIGAISDNFEIENILIAVDPLDKHLNWHICIRKG